MLDVVRIGTLLFIFSYGMVSNLQCKAKDNMNTLLMFIPTNDSTQQKQSKIVVYSGFQSGLANVNADSATMTNRMYHENGFGIRFQAILPMMIRFRYSNIPFQSNLNGFNVTVDQSMFEKFNSDYALSKSKRLSDEINSLDKTIALKSQELAYLKERYLIDQNSRRLPLDISGEGNLAFNIDNDSVRGAMTFKTPAILDSLSLPNNSQPLKDTPGLYIEESGLRREVNSIGIGVIQELKEDSAMANLTGESITPERINLDSIEYKENVIHNLSQEREQLRKRKKEIDILLNQNERSGFPTGGFSRFVSNHVKGISFGTIFPDFDDFIFKQSRMLGLEFELEGKYYLSFATGYQYTNRYFSPANSTINNQGSSIFGMQTLNSIGNAPELFTTGIKTGIGKKEEAHIYVGLLYAIPLTNSSGSFHDLNPRKNIVAEIDGGFKIGNAGRMNVIIAKSVSGDRSNFYKEGEKSISSANNLAAKVIFKSELKRLGTKFKFDLTGVQTGFQSTGYIQLRNDQLSLNMQLQQRVYKKLNFNARARKAFNNVSGTYGPEFTADYLQLSANFRPWRKLSTIFSAGISNAYFTNNEIKYLIRSTNLSASGIYQPGSKSKHRLLSTNLTYVGYNGETEDATVSQLNVVDEFKVDVGFLQGLNIGGTLQMLRQGNSEVNYYGIQLASRFIFFRKCTLILGINPQVKDMINFLYGYNSSISYSINNKWQLDLGTTSNTVFNPIEGRVSEQCTFYQTKITYSL
jgi:hypothetical protein